MLAGLLPGLRDLRTPLAVGYLWLIAVWLGLTPERRQDMLQILDDLNRALQVSVTLAALTFLAYTLGAIVTIGIEGTRSGRYLSYVTPYFSTITGKQDVHAYWAYIVDELVGENSPFREWPELQVHRKAAVLSSFFLPVMTLRMRLRAENLELFDEYDRLVSEAEFRINLSVPLLFIVAFGGTLYDLRYFLGIILVYALLIRGMFRLGESIAVLQRAVIEGAIAHPTRDKRGEYMETGLMSIRGELYTRRIAQMSQQKTTAVVVFGAPLILALGVACELLLMR